MCHDRGMPTRAVAPEPLPLTRNNGFDMFRFMVFLSFLLFMIRPAGAQSTTWDLTAKYGPPEVERYQVTPEASLTVAYGRDRAVCQFLVEPRSTSVFWSAPTKEPRTMSVELVDRLLNELVPPGVRHGKARQMFEQFSCSALKTEDYDNVQITRATNECVPAEKNVASIMIKWKRPACPEPKTAR
jgi:hypothetical protein